VTGDPTTAAACPACGQPRPGLGVGCPACGDPARGPGATRVDAARGATGRGSVVSSLVGPQSQKGRVPPERSASGRRRSPEKRLGRYVLLDELGRGSNGVVYKATQQGLEGCVALKVLLNARSVGGEALARFQREAQLAQGLDHPGIVGVIDRGHEGPHLFYVMEYAPGKTLADVLRTGPRPPDEAARTTRALAEILAYAHDQGVVHRDLKPANVIVDRKSGRPRITDFGLARQQDAGRGALTRSGDWVGTPFYMAPEQFTAAKDAGPRADLYALGVILYELLTGRRPLQAATSIEQARLVREVEPEPAAKVAPGVPRALDALCRRLLAKAPAERPADARAVAAELERYLAGRPGGAAGAPPGAAGGRRGRRAALVAVGAAAALGLGLAGLGLAVDGGATSEAAAERRDGAAAERAAGVAEALARVRELRAGGPGQLAGARVALERARRAAADDAGLLAEVEAEARALEALDLVAQAEGLLRTGEAGVAHERLARARRLAEGEAAPGVLPWVEGLEREQAVARALDDYTRACGLAAPFAEADGLLEDALAEAGADAALARQVRLERADLRRRRSRHEEALELLDELLAEEGLPADLEAAARFCRGLAFYQLQRPRDAYPELAHAAEAAPEPYRSTAAAHVAMLTADAQDPRPSLEEAIARATEAVEHDPEFGPAHVLMGRTYLSLRRVADADRCFRAAEEADPDDLHAWFWHALARFHLRDMEGRVEKLTHALELTAPRPHRTALMWRAHTLFLLKRFRPALADCEALLATWPDDVEGRMWRAGCWWALGERDRAAAEWRRLARDHRQRFQQLLRGQGASVENRTLQPMIQRVFQGGASGGGR